MLSEGEMASKVQRKAPQFANEVFEEKELFVKSVLRLISRDTSLNREKGRCFDDYAVDTIISSPVTSTIYSQYHLSQRALHQLAAHLPIGEEILNAYMKLLLTERC